MGCSGGCYGGYGVGCAGGYGGYGVGCDGGAGCGGVIYGPATSPASPAGGGKTGALSAPATIVVSLPAEAKLTIDGTPTTSTSALRTFSSPRLTTGKDYFYTLTAEVVRNGKPVSVTEKVVVRAGEERRVVLNFPAEAVAFGK